MKNEIKWTNYQNIPFKHEILPDKDKIAVNLMDKYFQITQKKKKRKLLFRVAASLFLLIGGCTVLYLTGERQIESNLNITEHLLPDGSTVKLLTNSVIKYNTNYWHFTRKVKLTGSAEFDVVKTNKPFCVKTKKIDIQVLGTIFEVSETDDQSNVLCKKGSVKVTSAICSEQLRAGEEINISINGIKRSSKATEEEFNSDKTKTTDIETFDAISIKELSLKLEQIYYRKFSISPNIAEKLYSGPIFTNDIEATLELISLSCNIKIEKKDNTYKLY